MSFEEAATGDAYARIAQLAERAKDMQASMAEIGATVTSLGGLVTVRVGFNGELQELTIDPRAMRYDAETLAQEIIAGYEEALGQQQDQMSELLGELMQDEDLGTLMTPGNQESLGALTEQVLKDAVAKVESATGRLRGQF